LAEDIKRSNGMIGDFTQIGEEKEILVKKNNLYKPIKQKAVLEIITSQAKSICSDIKEVLEKKVSSYEVNNFIVVGRTVLLEGFIETLENILDIPVKLGRISNPDIPSPIKEDNTLSGQKYFTYLTALGMISEALQGKALGVSSTTPPTKNPILKIVNRFKEVYQEYF
ncbi:MAG: cell division FtsA domain-containing protein, partial [Candidatus Omnitrophica bacterium]|nr:cell division FtsA domain-containing protein [Candidatus Omnitrophota bacterium]